MVNVNVTLYVEIFVVSFAITACALVIIAFCGGIIIKKLGDM